MARTAATTVGPTPRPPHGDAGRPATPDIPALPYAAGMEQAGMIGDAQIVAAARSLRQE